MTDRIAVVTGASRGLGKEIALRLAREGYLLVVCARGEAGLQVLQAEIEGSGGVCYPYPLDLSSALHEAKRRQFIGLWQRSPLHVLVNNAGMVHKLAPVEDLSPIDAYSVLFMNFLVPLEFMQSALVTMRGQGFGTIVNISSYCGRRGIPNLAVYCAAKGALRILTECVAKELEGTDIRIFSVSPGGMATQLRAFLFGPEDAAQQQSPGFVAEQVVAAIMGRLEVSNGADLVIRSGRAEIRPLGGQA